MKPAKLYSEARADFIVEHSPALTIVRAKSRAAKAALPSWAPEYTRAVSGGDTQALVAWIGGKGFKPCLKLV